MNTTTIDIRWKQRFENFTKVLKQLHLFVDKVHLNPLEEQGMIKSFEYTYELAWKTMKDFYESQGESDIQDSRDAIRLAYTRGLIEDGQSWMNMIKSRIQTAHTYDEEVAHEVAGVVSALYINLFDKLKIKMDTL